MILTDILESAGVETRSGTVEGELLLCCPFCRERGHAADMKFHFGLNVGRALGHCYRCDWKGRGLMFMARQLCRAYGVTMDLNKISRRQRKTLEVKETPPAVPETALSILDVVPEFETFDAYPSLPPDEVEKAARRYLKSRGVSVYQIVKHGIGYAAVGDFAWRVLFPVVDSTGGVHGCVGRAIVTKAGEETTPKYLNTRGMKILWNAQKPIGTAVVVEGVMDALRLERALLQVRNMTAVARLGAAITAGQLDQLKEFEQVVVLPDWDKAGIHGAIQLCVRCVERGISTRVSIPEIMNGSDPADMEEDVLVEMIRGAIPWNKDAEWRLRAAAKKELE